jgi:hypothetical protein
VSKKRWSISERGTKLSISIVRVLSISILDRFQLGILDNEVLALADLVAAALVFRGDLLTGLLIDVLPVVCGGICADTPAAGMARGGKPSARLALDRRRVAPEGPVGQEAFAVIRDTIAKLNMVALGRVVLARREHVIALEPKGRGLVGTTLRYPYEVRDEKPYFEDIPELKLPKEMLDLAAHIVHTKSGHFDPSQFEDRYENALIDLLRKKQAGEKIEPARETPPPRVVNLMEALRASIDAEQKKAPAPSTRARRPAKKKATR